jgi:hypothetical protein
VLVEVDVVGVVVVVGVSSTQVVAADTASTLDVRTGATANAVRTRKRTRECAITFLNASTSFKIFRRLFGWRKPGSIRQWIDYRIGKWARQDGSKHDFNGKNEHRETLIKLWNLLKNQQKLYNPFFYNKEKVFRRTARFAQSRGVGI